MANFCAQCAEEIGFDRGDFLGATSLGDQMAGLYALVLCEGCGVVLVDWRGRCISGDCVMKGHKAAAEPAMARLQMEGAEAWSGHSNAGVCIGDVWS